MRTAASLADLILLTGRDTFLTISDTGRPSGPRISAQTFAPESCLMKASTYAVSLPCSLDTVVTSQSIQFNYTEHMFYVNDPGGVPYKRWT